MYLHDRESRNEEPLQKAKASLSLGQEQIAHSSLCLGMKSLGTVGLGAETFVSLSNECTVPRKELESGDSRNTVSWSNN